MLLLGEFPGPGWHDGQRQQLAKQFLAIFENESDPGLHAAAQWLLRKWQCDQELKAAIERLGKTRPSGAPPGLSPGDRGMSTPKARRLS